MKPPPHPIKGHGGPEGEYRSTCTLSLILALGGVGDQRHAPAALPPKKRTGTHCAGDCVALGKVWTGVEILSPPPEFDLQTMQAVASRYTDYAMQTHGFVKINIINTQKCRKNFGEEFVMCTVLTQVLTSAQRE